MTRKTVIRDIGSSRTIKVNDEICRILNHCSTNLLEENGKIYAQAIPGHNSLLVDEENLYWRKSTRELIDVDDMTPNHVTNVINLLQRKGAKSEIDVLDRYFERDARKSRHVRRVMRGMTKPMSDAEKSVVRNFKIEERFEKPEE